MVNSSWKKIISVLMSVFVLSVGSVALSGCDTGEETEVEGAGGEELEVETEGDEVEVEEEE